MSYDTNNIFAKIIRGEIPCNKVYEDEAVLVWERAMMRRREWMGDPDTVEGVNLFMTISGVSGRRSTSMWRMMRSFANLGVGFHRTSVAEHLQFRYSVTY